VADSGVNPDAAAGLLLLLYVLLLLFVFLGQLLRLLLVALFDLLHPFASLA